VKISGYVYKFQDLTPISGQNSKNSGISGQCPGLHSLPITTSTLCIIIHHAIPFFISFSFLNTLAVSSLSCLSPNSHNSWTMAPLTSQRAMIFRSVSVPPYSTFKISDNNYNISHNLFFDLDDDDRRGDSKKLFEKWFRWDIRKYVFSNCIVDKWESLPDTRVHSHTTNTFKSHILSRNCELC